MPNTFIPKSRSETPLGLYIHVPFCATRCGYCDFNTYTPGELGSSSSPEQWLTALDGELSMAAAHLDPPRPVSTIFVGGGTPSLLGAVGLRRVMASVRTHFDISPGAEVTTESNPESTSPQFFEGILASGFTRVSLGMQSAASHVLAVLDRTHTPGRAITAARERDEDLASSLDAVLDAGVDHVSAYALIVEDGTALARRVRRGQLPAPDDDVLANRYEMIDKRLSAAGLQWYEVSNWARASVPDAFCRHNLGYWDSADWWGAGPGAHSHVAGVRWWNHKHPAKYAAAVAGAELPVAGHERLSSDDRHTERVMLAIRRSLGLAWAELRPDEQQRAAQTIADGLTERVGSFLVLTNRGRLLADGVVRDLLTG